jgi:hypothetical protein
VGWPPQSLADDQVQTAENSARIFEMPVPGHSKGAAGNFLGAEPGARDCTTTQNYSVSYTY